MDALALEHLECALRQRVLGIEREPPRQQLDAVFLQRLDLGVEGGYVLSAPIIGEGLDAQLVQHLCSLFRSALQGVKRHDAPGVHIAVRPERVRRSHRCASQGEYRGSECKGRHALCGCWHD